MMSLHQSNVCECVRYLSQVEEEAGVLAGLRQVGQEHCDTDQQHCGVLPHATQRLSTQHRQLSLNNGYSFWSIHRSIS